MGVPITTSENNGETAARDIGHPGGLYQQWGVGLNSRCEAKVSHTANRNVSPSHRKVIYRGCGDGREVQNDGKDSKAQALSPMELLESQSGGGRSLAGRKKSGRQIMTQSHQTVLCRGSSGKVFYRALQFPGQGMGRDRITSIRLESHAVDASAHKNLREETTLIT